MLVIAQVTLAFVLLSSAGLLIRSFLAVLNQQVELRTDRVLTFGLALPQQQYPEIASVETFDRELERRLSTLPGAYSAGFGTDLPLEGHSGRLIALERAESGAKPVVDYSDIEGDYFRSIGFRLIAGRLFNDHDRKNSERVAIVNGAFARAFWPGESALGHRFKFGPSIIFGPWVRIVGVVADTNARSPDQPVAPHLYCPFEQEVYAPAVRQAWFVLRTHADALTLAGDVRATVHALNPTLPVVKLRSMEQVLSVAIAPRSANTWLITVFALAALLLTALGVYGVVAQSVAERTREIGIRMALGALRSAVLRSVLWDGARLVLIGLGLGIGTCFAASRLIGSLLYGVSSNDTLTLAGVTVLLALTALAALVLPSWRAIQVDPYTALREE